ncbi:flagellin [Alphaproteobacteria bacterium]|nr:flagellin [Alphaproteobacteria bacterium]
MGMVVNTNVSSLIAQSAANGTSKSLETAMERLSTGKRINSAADDAAGSAIATRMTSQIKGLNQAIRNAGDAQSLIDTTEGAHDEITNILQRMRELSVQAASDTNVSADRSNLQLEIDQLSAEINRISSQTTWNGMSVLDGTFTNKSFQIGADASQDVKVSVESVATGNLGNNTFESIGGLKIGAAVADPFTADSYTITGGKGSATVSALAADSAKEFAAKINAQTASTGVSATAVTKVLLKETIATTAQTAAFTSAAQTFTMNLNGVAIDSSSILDTDMSDLVDKINAKSSQHGVTAELGATSGEVILTDADGDTIDIDTIDSSVDTFAISVQVLNSSGTAALADAADFDADDSGEFGHVAVLHDTDHTTSDQDSVSIGGSTSFTSTAAFTVEGGATTSATVMSHIQAASRSSTLSNISATNISTAAGAQTAIKAIDGALEMVSERRANLGAISNRMDNTVANLTSIKTNLEGSRSRIEDADFAAETAQLTKSQILQQAATSMLAQANASKQSVLSLLQG